MPWLQLRFDYEYSLRYDYDPTTTHRARLLPFYVSKKWIGLSIFRRSRRPIVVESQVWYRPRLYTCPVAFCWRHRRENKHCLLTCVFFVVFSLVFFNCLYANFIMIFTVLSSGVIKDRLYRPKPIHCNYHVDHYSGFSRISPSILNRFTPNLQA